MLAVIGLAAVLLLGGLGYSKYRTIRRVRIEKAVIEGLQAAPSATLRGAHLSVSVNDAGEITLDGTVQNAEDLSAATNLAAAVPGVMRVSNRLQIVPAPPAAQNVQPESSDSLVNRGMGFMDEGKYSDAIDCFTKAANDPNNTTARELLETARRAQKTEDQLLKKRQ